MDKVNKVINWVLIVAGLFTVFCISIHYQDKFAKLRDAAIINKHEYQKFKLACSIDSNGSGWAGTAVYDRTYAVYTYWYCTKIGPNGMVVSLHKLVHTAHNIKHPANGG